MGTAYLVRHFETQSNAQGLFGDGPLDDVPTERGIKQGNTLRKVYTDGWNINDVYGGNSIRNNATAAAFGFPARMVHLIPDLNEQHPGEWAGKSKKDITPQLLADWRSGAYKIPGSELDADFEIRVLKFWQATALSRLREGENLVVATSGNPIRAILGNIFNTYWRHLLPALVLDNCGITTIKVNKEGKCFVGPVNDISHLRNVGVTSIPGT